MTFDEFLQECAIVVGFDSTVNWIGESFLLEHEVRPFTDLPLWVPQGDAGNMQIDCQKALRDGLSLRPLSETIRDTLEWANTRSADYQWQNGLLPQREADLLHEWVNRHE